MKTAVAWWVGCAIWFVGVTAAMLAVWSYKTTDNGSAQAPEQWPRESTLALDPSRPTLVMFSHPHCPCTKASLSELTRLADELGATVAIQIVLVRPADAGDGFEDGELRARAGKVPRATLVVDRDARESERFHAKTSGSVVLYSREGRLLFSGGITSARGHEGRAPSHDRIVAAVAGQLRETASAPTFGCALESND